MSDRVITIKRAGTANNVMYRDVLVGCFEDGDTETLAMIIDSAIDIYIEKSRKKQYEQVVEGCKQIADMSYDFGRKGYSKSNLQQVINAAIKFVG